MRRSFVASGICPFIQYRGILVAPRIRARSDHCGGPRQKKLSWPSHYQPVTDRLADACGQLLEGKMIRGVTRFYGLGTRSKALTLDGSKRLCPSRTARRSAIWPWTSSRRTRGMQCQGSPRSDPAPGALGRTRSFPKDLASLFRGDGQAWSGNDRSNRVGKGNQVHQHRPAHKVVKSARWLYAARPAQTAVA